MLGWTIRYTRNHMVSTQYLEQMAAKGWMLKIYGEAVMIFKKCEPRKLRFAVDHMGKERHQFLENRKSPQVQEYLALCEESGWEFVAGDGYLYIFCTEDDNAVPLQTDARTYLDSIHYRKQSKLIKWIIAAVFVAIFYGFPLLENYSKLLLVEGSAIFYLTFGFVMATLIGEIAEFGLILRRERRILESGQLPDTDPSGRRGQWERWILPAVWVCVYGVSLYFSGYRSAWGLVILLGSYFLLAIIDAIIHHLAWNYFGHAHVTKGFLLSGIVEMTIAVFLLGGGLMPRAERPMTDPSIIADRDWEPPIVMADLGRESHPDRVTKTVEGSSKAREYYYHEGLGKEDVSYTIYVSDNESAVMMQMVEDKYDRNLEQIRLDVLDLGLDEAITWAGNDGTLRKMIWIRSGNYVMKIYTGFTLTEDQLKIVADRFLQWIRENPYP